MTEKIWCVAPQSPISYLFVIAAIEPQIVSTPHGKTLLRVSLSI